MELLTFETVGTLVLICITVAIKISGNGYQQDIMTCTFTLSWIMILGI